jgi:hypothetical protein
MGAMFALALLLAACGDGRPRAEDFAVTGSARFADAEGEAPGSGESLRAFATLFGTGTFLDPDCPVRNPTGRFRARFDGTVKLAEDGSFTLRMPARDVVFATEDGCRLGGVDVDRIDAITVRGALRPSAAACDAYARAKAGRTGGSPDITREACLRQGTTAIVAQQRFAIDPGAVRTVVLPVELVFQRLERLDGSVVDEEDR